MHWMEGEGDSEQQKDQCVCLLILTRKCRPEVVSLPWSLHLASAATLWEPQVWHLTLRFCSAIEKRPGFSHWCPHAPGRGGAHQLCSLSAPSASPTWSTPHCPCPHHASSPTASFSSFLQNRNYFAHFLSKSKNRKEKGTANLAQLLVLLLNKVILQ